MEHGQDSQPKVAKGIFLTTEHHSQYINWGVGQEGSIINYRQAGHQSVDGEQWFCASFIFLGFYYFLFCYLSFHCNYIAAAAVVSSSISFLAIITLFLS